MLLHLTRTFPLEFSTGHKGLNKRLNFVYSEAFASKIVLFQGFVSGKFGRESDLQPESTGMFDVNAEILI